MTHAALSVFAFGVYMVGQGAILLLAPDLILIPAGMPPAVDGWIRVVGLCLVVLSYYYMQAARAELREFFGWTVHMRIFQFVAFTGLVLAEYLQPIGLVFSLVEMAAGIWTLVALKSQRPLHSGN